MTEMIERVAEALRADGISGTVSRYLARKAIEAMREPTEAMVEAGWNARGEAADRYQAMIDAALTPNRR